MTSAEGLKNIAKLVNDGNTGIDIILTGNITLRPYHHGADRYDE